MQDILNRTSVRKFQTKKIEPEVLKQILQAGFSAPSAKNTQPWEFLIVQNPQTLEKMSSFTPYATPIKNAPLGMLVCANINCNPFIDYCEQDCAAATENMLIAAKKLGIGSCWIGVYPNAERVEPIRQYFSLPENIVPLWMIAFGYPAETPKVKNKWNENKIHYEKF